MNDWRIGSVKIFESCCYLCELMKCHQTQWGRGIRFKRLCVGVVLTSSNSSISASFIKYCLRSPFSIHGDTMKSIDLLMTGPMKGSTFGCRKFFHTLISRSALCSIKKESKCLLYHHNDIESRQRGRKRTFTAVSAGTNECEHFSAI